MGLYDNFPYTNTHELNTDWIVKKIGDIDRAEEASEASAAAAKASEEAAADSQAAAAQSAQSAAGSASDAQTSAEYIEEHADRIDFLQTEIDQIVAPTGEAPNPAEITNARIGIDGTVYDTLGNAIRGQVGALKSTTDSLFNESVIRAFPSTQYYSNLNTANLFLNTSQQIPPTKTAMFKFHSGSSYGNMHIVFFTKKSENVYTKVDDVLVNLSGSDITFQSFTNYSNTDLYYGFYSQNTGVKYRNDGDTESFIQKAYSSITDGDNTIVSLTANLNFDYSLLVYDIYSEVLDNEYYVTVGNKGTYKNITDALGDTQKRPIVLLEGTYNEYVNTSDKINIQGVDRERCIIRSTNGLYANQTMKVCRGELRNLTIIAEYVSGESEELTPSTNGAYAIHVEDESGAGETLLIKDCTLISDFNTPIGVGLRGGQTVILDNCVLINNQTSTRGIQNNGALYFHNPIGQDHSPCKIIVKNCVIQSTQDKAIRIQNAESYITAEDDITVEFINNTIYSESNGLSSNDSINLDNDPFGGDHFHMSPLSNGNTVPMFNQ